MIRFIRSPDAIARRTTLALTCAAAALLAAESAVAQAPSDHNPVIHHDPASAVGDDAVAIGAGAVATGDYALALGAAAVAGMDADDEYATAVGFQSVAGYWGTALGGLAQAIGDAAVAVGSYAEAGGHYSVALGSGAVAGFSEDDWFATALGFEAQAGFWSTAVGARAEATGETSSAFGYWATASGESSTALGAMATADGMWSTAIGGAWAQSDESIAIGMGAQTNAYGTGADRAIVIGSAGMATGHDSIAIGYMSITDGDRAMALGTSVDLMNGFAFGAFADDAVAVGYGSLVTAKGSVAIGTGSSAMEEGVFSVGRGGDDLYGRGAFTRRIVNVADGVIAEDSTDAVTGGQLFTVQALVNANAAAIIDNANLITGLDGRVGDAETAIAALQAGAAVDLPIATDNTSGAAAPNAAGHDSLAAGWGAQAAGDGAVALGANSLAEGDNSLAAAGGVAQGAFSIALGESAQAGEDLSLAMGHGAGAHALGAVAFGAGAQANAMGSVALGTGSIADEADTVSVGADGFERRIVNVADGRIAHHSTDAVTGGQLFAAHQAFTSALGGGAGFDAAGLFTPPSYVILGSTYGDVGGALGALNTQVTTNKADIETIKGAGSGGGDGGTGGDDGRDAEIAALRAQMDAMRAMLDRLEQGALSGGAASGEGTTAAGEGAVAEQFGDTAFGAGAKATGDPSTAIGYASLASGQHSTAIGGNAAATGDLSTALGQGSIASGANSLALGQGAKATHDNAIAIGQGVATTRDDQVAIGTADHTYTLAGVASDVSRAAQSGPVFMVTSDLGGNLATMDMQPWFDRVDDLEGRVGGLEGRMDGYDARWRVADRHFERQADGVAMALALGGAQVLQPGQTFSMSANIGHFDGANAVGFGAIGRLNERVSVNVGVGTGFRTGVVSGRAGVSFGW